MKNLEIKKLLTMAALAASLSVVTMAEANAWTRSGTVTGPNGNSVTRSGSGGCAGGVCAGTRTTTGPRGNSVTRSGVATRGHAGYGHYRGYRYGGVAAGVAVGAAVGAAAATSAYGAPAPAYVAAPAIYAPRAYYYPGYYYELRPYYYGRTLAYYRPY